ncbi:hypothetical protein [Dehalobacter sp. CF]|uniref:hypothetical protein n=1 Tax=Dehalobacter sp. CF TaxID=1131462 RepID=UPI00028B62D2|nr:hypothetical protein [Dehalobacter sp. CF]AFV05121.1 hypothetical protein DCF50_p1116 [Dehalobacter sp. CF]
MLQFQVSNLFINVHSDNLGSFNSMKNYLCKGNFNGDLNFYFDTKDNIEIPKGELISDEEINIKWLKKDSNQDGYYIYAKNHGCVGDTIALMDVAPDWRSASITLRNIDMLAPAEYNFNQSQSLLATHILMGVVFRYFLIHFQGLVGHASSIKWQGKGLMFSAPSGTGKSTHVKLWQKYIPDVTVLNDDTPAIRLIDKKPIIFGTPWSGSSFINCNDSAPLEAIVLLEQSPINEIRKLTINEAIMSFMPRVMFPYFNMNYMNEALRIFEQIVLSVPVYLLKCRPDQEAVELVYQCMK